LAAAHTQSWFRKSAKISRFHAQEHAFPGRIVSTGARRTEVRAKETAGKRSGVLIMLSWVVTFLVIALIAGILGFGGIAGASVEIAKAIFFIAVILFLVSAVVGLVRGRTRV
jgi:uncharacterized membrane protein YtjA (UPF0391 family)